ncbi:MAG: 3-dehydroquinate synthase [Pseudomonadota bacterium]
MALENLTSQKNNESATVSVELGNRSYLIHIANNSLKDVELFQHVVQNKNIVIISNAIISQYYASTLQNTLKNAQARTVSLIEIPDGESFKTLETCEMLWSKLLEKKSDRQTILVALGGGVIGDITGFVAACYQRGIDFIQVPTTLLSQVDSSVGGKTGVNHPLGKNMIGAFYQPKKVIIDPQVLKTLPDREYRSGWAEIIKYGLIWDAEFLKWIENNASAAAARDSNILIHAIRRSCQIKADIVAQDERESDIRALLNFGHTFGHALETLTHYQYWLHGEAILIGMLMATKYSLSQGWISEDTFNRLLHWSNQLGFKLEIPQNISVHAMIEAMKSDKKNKQDQIHLVVLTETGRAKVISDVDKEMLHQVIELAIHGKWSHTKPT